MRTLRTVPVVGLFLFLLFAALTTRPVPSAPAPLAARSSGDGAGGEKTAVVEISESVLPTLAPPFATLPTYEPEYYLDREINPRQNFSGRLIPDVQTPGGRDPLLDRQAAGPAPSDPQFLAPVVNIDGQGYSGVNPPDTVGDVGPDHYVQLINAGGGAVVRVYDKAGAALGGQWALDSLGTGNCASGLGDPIVLWDDLAGRWLLSEFSSSGNRLCVYISQTADPITTSWYAYNFAAPSFPDYPKYAVWPNAYIVTTNEANSTTYALNRQAMLSGAAASFQRFTAPDLSGFGFQAMTPADFDGWIAPPAGAPGIVMRHRDTEVHGVGSCVVTAAQDCLELWELRIDWATPSNSTFTQAVNIPVANFDSDLCGLTSFYCIGMPGVPTGSSSSLDPLREVIMNRLQYRNFGTHEALVGNLVTDVNGANQAGVRWFELRRLSGGGWTLYQEGTYAPDGHSRWMGSIAMDVSGNLALGYNISSSTVYPGLRYVGRLAGDPLGTLPQGEAVLIEGASRNGSNRYGDYASLNVDPVDGCTFWFTGQYNQGTQWSTRIGAFRFDACGSADFTLAVAPAAQEICRRDTAVFNVTLGAFGGFTDPVTLSANAPGSVAFGVNPLMPPGSTTLNISGAPAGTYQFDVTGVADQLQHTAPAALTVRGAAPAAPTLLSPPDGAPDTPIYPTLTWAPTAEAADYLVQIATDPNFTNIVASATVATPTYTSNVALAALTPYYWRVQPRNTCGAGQMSAVFRFTTINISCTLYNSANVPLPIPPSGTSGTTNSTLSIADTGAIIDVNVRNLVGTHTWIGDLRFSLRSPAGTTVTLLDRVCSSADNFNVNFDDAATGAPPCPPTDGGTYRPASPLAAFNGQPRNGVWALVIEDLASSDSGVLQSWGLEICAQTAVPLAVELTQTAVGRPSPWLPTLALAACLSAGALWLTLRRR